MASLRPPSRVSGHPSRPARRIFPFSLSLFLRTIAFAERARRSADPPLAVRRIVTKGFAVIPDLICMLMVMDVYLLLFPGFVVACYPPFKSCLRERSAGRSAEMQVAANVLSGSSRVHTCLLKAATRQDVDKNSIDLLQCSKTDVFTEIIRFNMRDNPFAVT